MKLLMTTAAALALSLPAYAQPQWLDCTRIDMGGYFIYADPTCPQLEGDGADHPTITLPDLGGSEDDDDVTPPEDDDDVTPPEDDDDVTPPEDDDDVTPPEDDDDDEDDGRQGCNGNGCAPGSGPGNSEGNEQSDQDGD